MVVSHERSASTSAAITAPPVSFEPPGPKPSRPGPRSPAWPLGHRPSCDRPSCALSRPEPIKLTVPAVLSFAPCEDMGDGARYICEVELAATVWAMRELCGPDWAPSESPAEKKVSNFKTLF